MNNHFIILIINILYIYIYIKYFHFLIIIIKPLLNVTFQIIYLKFKNIYLI